MAPMRVLRFARSDDESGFVLLQVTPKVKHDRVSSLRVKNCPASEAEWQGILEALLRQEPLPDIQATATVQSGSSISITVRKQIQGITQRLGAITLNQNDEEPIELFEWCGAAVEAADDGKEALAELTAKSHDMEAAAAQLRSQLEELIQAKEEDETALLQKFRDLLNEKKVKIREQQRVLATSGSFNASLPGSSSQQSQPAPPPTAPSKPARKPTKSRAAKRKAPSSKRGEDEEDEEVEPMEVDPIKQEDEETDPGNTTEGTTSVASDDDEDEAPVSSSRKARTPSPARESRTKASPKKATEQPPPPRALPFTGKKQSKPVPAPAPATGSETESDDEL
ncbi:Fc.00g015060.m01.CDS01 [Cosmosporella sp. VM-42]